MKELDDMSLEIHVLPLFTEYFHETASRGNESMETTLFRYTSEVEDGNETAKPDGGVRSTTIP